MLAVVAGLFVIPTFSITRQAVTASVDETDRRTAISLDSAAIELSFMIASAIAARGRRRWATSSGGRRYAGRVTVAARRFTGPSGPVRRAR